MKRNFYTGEFIFSKEETDILALAISDRCDCMLEYYRTAVANENTGAADYFSREFKDACVLYKEFFGTNYPASTDEGVVPDNADS